MSAPTPTLFLCASRDELSVTLRRLERRQSWRQSDLMGLEGEIDGFPVVIAWTGEGPYLARQAVLSLGGLPLADPILVLGVAGALQPRAELGDLVVAEHVRYGDRILEPPQASLGAALRHPAVSGGELVTVNRIVDTDTERVELWQGMGEPEVGCVDMESGAFAEAASEQGRSLLVVRAISDRRGDRLPEFLGRCRRADGSIDRARVVLGAVLRPWSVPQLMRLQRRVAHCSARLDDFVLWWLDRGQKIPAREGLS